MTKQSATSPLELEDFREEHPLVETARMYLGNYSAVLVETVFSWPGLGTLAVQAIVARDTPTILGILFFSSLVVVVANLLTDLVYRIIDPRITTSDD